MSASCGFREIISGMGLWSEESTLAVLEQNIIFMFCADEMERLRRWCNPAIWSFSKALRGREKLTAHAE